MLYCMGWHGVRIDKGKQHAKPGAQSGQLDRINERKAMTPEALDEALEARLWHAGIYGTVPSAHAMAARPGRRS